MFRFAVIVLLVSFLGWMVENLLYPWIMEKFLQARIQQELEWQRSQPQVNRCTCEWFDSDTFIRDPDCQSSDHGNIQKILQSIYRRDLTKPYKIKYRKE